MNDHIKRISAEEELAARLTASALGELSAEEQAELEAELAQRPSSGDALRATADSSSRAEVERLANALRQADRTEAFPEPSASLRELLESKLAGEEAVVELKRLGSHSIPRRRIWIALATGLSLLLVAIPVWRFWMIRHSRDSKAQITQLQVVNERLRSEAREADDRLALIQ
ncbi:MAG: hypothetical protein HYV60_05295, partial [Planctomycetia bacterium]|nr:hypothetical protein [Planctomycetia bacterium]